MKGLLATIICLLCVTTACSSSPSAGSSSSVSAAPSSAAKASPTPTYTLPPRPKVDKPQFTPTGELRQDLESFGRYALKVYSYTMATRDPSLWEGIAAKGCTFCDETRDELKKTKPGQWSKVEFDVKKSAVFDSLEYEHVYRIDYLVERSAFVEYEPTMSHSLKASTHTVSIAVKVIGNQMKIVSWEIATPQAFGTNVK
ncbi:hypothetical protein [Arcanobacterium canis]